MRNPSLSQPRSADKEKALKTFGGNLRRERTARRITQDKLAELAGLSARTIAKIEAGELGVRPETVDRIRNAIGCSAKTLLPAKVKFSRTKST